MTESSCPVHRQNQDGHQNADRRKSAAMATRNTAPDAGAHWVKSATVARKVLRSKYALQAGAGADQLHFDDPQHAPVFFLDGKEHFSKRQKTGRFLSPKAVTEQHTEIMQRIAGELLQDFQKEGQGKLENISFQLAIEVVGEILGLTNSDQAARAKRIQRVLHSSLAQSKPGLSRLLLRTRQAFHTMNFFLRDVKPAIEARKNQPRNDAISFYLEEGYPTKAIIVECLTYGTAGMLTTREFITMCAWYLFEDESLRQRYLDSDSKGQLDILLEILRLEPVAAMIHRKVNEEVDGLPEGPLPAGETYGIDIRRINVSEEMAGECPFAVDPDRAQKMQNTGRYMSFGDGPHSCPGWQVALHETRIFLDQLFRIPGLKLEREPDMNWNPQLKSYELRNADISCSAGN